MFNRKFNTDQQNIYITSDLHFDHANILRFCPDTRPFKSVQDMNEFIISHWNSIVNDDDIIIHLGDFCFKGADVTESFLSRLNGQKIMIHGNHDKALRSSIPVGKHNIIWKGDYLELKINSQKVVLSHYPMLTWNNAHRGAIQCYGHCHGSLPEQRGRQTDVGYDARGKIENIMHIMRALNKREVWTPDGH